MRDDDASVCVERYWRRPHHEPALFIGTVAGVLVAEHRQRSAHHGPDTAGCCPRVLCLVADSPLKGRQIAATDAIVGPCQPVRISKAPPGSIHCADDPLLVQDGDLCGQRIEHRLQKSGTLVAQKITLFSHLTFTVRFSLPQEWQRLSGR